MLKYLKFWFFIPFFLIVSALVNIALAVFHGLKSFYKKLISEFGSDWRLVAKVFKNLSNKG